MTPLVPFEYTLCGDVIQRVSVTIPINTSITATVASLIFAANGYDGGIRWFKVLPVLADGTTARPAIRLASKRIGASAFVESDFATHGEVCASGVEFVSGPSGNAGAEGIRSESGSTITVTIVFCS
jgi:hypothetical protein